MATDVERLVVSLEASITKYERTMQKALGVTNSTMQRIERRQMTAVQRVNAGWTGMQRGLATAFAGAAALRGAQQLVDASTRIENSLKVTGLAGDDLTRVYDTLFASAQRNMAPLETLATLYSRLGLSQKELGVTTDQLLSFTDNVALALRVQGTSAQEARGTLIQLSQAMGSGIIRAEEFNSVVEGAPTILRAAAAGLVEAGGSVAKLRTLVIEGKISSKAFFDAFQAGSVVLREQVAGAEVTISQGFVRLQNVLVDTAGKFDTATNASTRIAGTLQQLTNAIAGAGSAADANAPAINRFLDFISKAGNELGDSMFAGTAREFEGIAKAVDAVAASADRYDSSVTDAEIATAAAEQALVNFGANTKGQFGELQPVVDDFIQQLLEGRGTANSAAIAINEIGKAGDFGTLIGQLGSIVTALFAVRSEAVATAAAVAAAQRGETAGTNIEGQRSEQLSNRPVAAVKPVTLADYAVPTGSGGGGKGGGGSKSDQYATAVANQEKEIAALQRKTQIQAQLNPLVNDYGYALERLNAQIELENAATEAGLSLTPERQAQIALLSQGYAQATSEAARLAEAQDMVKKTAEEMGQASRAALDTIVDGFLEGKDAGEIFNSVLKDLAKSFLKMGLDSLGTGMKAGGFNPLSMLTGIFGFANGGIAKNGTPMKTFARGGVSNTAAIFGEGPMAEAAVPLPDGRRIPVDLRMPSLPAAGSGSGALTVHVISDDEKFSAYVTDKAGSVVAQASPSIVGASVRQSNKSAPSAVAQFQQQRGGSDYRTS